MAYIGEEKKEVLRLEIRVMILNNSSYITAGRKYLKTAHGILLV